MQVSLVLFPRVTSSPSYVAPSLAVTACTHLLNPPSDTDILLRCPRFLVLSVYEAEFIIFPAQCASCPLCPPFVTGTNIYLSAQARNKPSPLTGGKNRLFPAPQENYSFSFTLYFEIIIMISSSAPTLPPALVFGQNFLLSCWLEFLSGAERVLWRDFVLVRCAVTQVLSERWDSVLQNEQISCRSP